MGCLLLFENVTVLHDVDDAADERHEGREVDEDVGPIVKGGAAKIGKGEAIEQANRDGDHLEHSLELAEDVRGDHFPFGSGDEAHRVHDEVTQDHQDDAEDGDGHLSKSERGWDAKEDQQGIDEHLVRDRVEEFAEIRDLVPFSREIAIDRVRRGGDHENDAGDEIGEVDAGVPKDEVRHLSETTKDLAHEKINEKSDDEGDPRQSDFRRDVDFHSSPISPMKSIRPCKPCSVEDNYLSMHSMRSQFRFTVLSSLTKFRFLA